MKLKKRKGVTLMEIVVAMTILTMLAAPILALSTQMAHNSHLAKNKTLGLYTAQMLMEECIDNTEAELTAKAALYNNAARPDYNGFRFVLTVSPVEDAANLRRVTITAYSDTYGKLAELSNIIYVSGGTP